MAKSVTKAQREKLRRAMATAGVDIPGIASEMQRRFAFRPRESCRHAHGWSQDQAAHAYNIAEGSGDAPMTGTRISAYECWPLSGERPSPRTLTVLARAYGVDVSQLIDFEDLEHMPAGDRQLILELSGLASTTRSDVRLVAAPSVELVRDVPPPIVSAEPLPTPPRDGAIVVSEKAFLMNTARESAAFAHRAGQTNVGPTDLDQLDGDLDRIARNYLTEPMIPLLGDMRELRNTAFGLLEGRQYPEQSRHLYLLAGQACGLLASASSDLGRYNEADTHARTAWLCAELAGHNKLRAWVLATRSIIAFWDGRGHKAVEHATRGAEYVDGLELVRLRSLEARARARLGDEVGTRAAIQAAETACEHVSDEHEYSGMFAFPVANQERCAGNAFLWLRRHDESIQSLERALAAFEADALPEEPSYAHTAVTRLDLTLAHLQQGDFDGAREALSPVLELPPSRRLAGVVRRTERLQRLLTSHTFRTTTAAGSLSERIEEFSAGASLRQLPGATS
jgi:tetratricopeptide (TPR) repeat protein/transcriptional regulator with XRE-family HTH domain